MQVFEIFNESGKAIACFRPKVIKLHGKKVDNIVIHRSIKSVYSAKQNLNAEINLTKQTIRIYGTEKGVWDTKAKDYTPIQFDRTYKVGDIVETGSYNLTYTNPIVKFTAKNVVVNKGGDSNTFMKLDEFIYRNWDLDLEKIKRSNHETSMYI